MKNLEKMLRLSLQFFADGGAEGGGAAGEGAVESGEGPSDDDLFMARMEQKYGIANGVASAQAIDKVRAEESLANSQKAEAETVEGADVGTDEEPRAEAEPSAEQKSPEEEFDELIKSDKFKGIFGKRVASAVSDRFKNQTDATAEAEKYKSTLSQFAGKYGKDPGDIEGIMAAIAADDELLEGEAIKRGKSVTELREDLKAEAERTASQKEISDLKAKVAEYENREKATADVNRWVEEAKEASKIYKNFDLRSELKNPEFMKYLQRDRMSVAEAYKHAHIDDIIAGSVQAVERRADENAAATVKSNLNRFKEGAAVAHRGYEAPRIDVNNMSDEDFRKIDEMLERGEEVTLKHLRR